ncbi:MAG: FKBP-type peptidyl-prolyl cis-trans isomerase [Deltaproteobacteria bacterium]|nr:FKBP-type peptidyl-prolyl cis-trans isomerase [Deltaproteobacteria bacterium]
MKSLLKTFLCITLIAFVLGCQDTKQQSDSAIPETDKDKMSYAIGVNMGQSISEIKDEIDLTMLQKGMSDKIQGNELLVSDEEAQALLRALSAKLNAKKQEEVALLAQKNLEAGKAYLEENKIKEGVITTESGLQYKIIKEGEGKSPKKSDRITVHYEGTKIDGSVFDSSYKRGEPVTFQIDRVIKGWTEGLQLMKEGGKYKLFVPADLAYGESGAGQQIGPNEVLLFDVEIVKVLDEQHQGGKNQAEKAE